MRELFLYTRPGCHLCEEMQAGLASLRDRLGFAVREIEVGWDGALAERYGRLLPVLELDGDEVCHYFLDEGRLAAALAASPRVPRSSPAK